jgi:hypothetical protein
MGVCRLPITLQSTNTDLSGTVTLTNDEFSNFRSGTGIKFVCVGGEGDDFKTWYGYFRQYPCASGVACTTTIRYPPSRISRNVTNSWSIIWYLFSGFDVSFSNVQCWVHWVNATFGDQAVRRGDQVKGNKSQKKLFKLSSKNERQFSRWSSPVLQRIQ